MKKETYERLYMDVTEFDAEDVITTSEETMPDLIYDDNQGGAAGGVGFFAPGT